MKKEWKDIEGYKVRMDVGSSLEEAMSSSMGASVICFTTDGHIVLNGISYVADSTEFKQVEKDVSWLKSDVEGLQTDMAELLPRVDTIESDYLTEVHIGGEPLEKDGEHSVNLPYAYFSMSGENADGVISGEDWRKFQYAYSIAEQLAGANAVQPLKVEADINKGYFIGLWQDGNTYKGGYIPQATEGNMGLLAGEFQPYLVSLWNLYESGDVMEEELSDMASDKELKQVEKDLAGLSEKVKNLPSVDTSKLATTASLYKTMRFCVLPFSWLMEFGSNVPTIEGSGIAGSGSTTVYFSRNAKLFLVPSGMMRYYRTWGDGFDNVLDSQSYENANLFLCTDDNTIYRRKDDGSLAAVSASAAEDISTLKAQVAELQGRLNMA